MKRPIICLVACYFLISCGERAAIPTEANRRPDQASTEIKKDTAKRTVSNAPREEIFTYPCAIIIEPTDKKIDSLQHAYSDQEYSSILDDNLHYVEIARELFKAKALKTIEKKPIGILKFKKADGNIAEMPITEFLWGVVLFNGKSDPIETDLTMIEEEYNRYMK